MRPLSKNTAVATQQCSVPLAFGGRVFAIDEELGAEAHAVGVGVAVVVVSHLHQEAARPIIAPCAHEYTWMAHCMFPCARQTRCKGAAGSVRVAIGMAEKTVGHPYDEVGSAVDEHVVRFVPTFTSTSTSTPTSTPTAANMCAPESTPARCPSLAHARTHALKPTPTPCTCPCATCACACAPFVERGKVANGLVGG